jgi:pimeloyl-ACP methyl ester carboxylesterase
MKFPPRDDWRMVGGVRSFSRVQGQGQPLVIVPGMGCAHFCYRPLQALLSPYFEVWAYDPPGQGYSQAPVNQFCTMREVSDHLAAWLEATGLRGCTLFGHSQGGEIAIDLAARYPGLVSGLVLCAPTGIPEYPDIAAQIWHLCRNALRERPLLCARVIRAYFMASPSRVWALLQDQLTHDTEPLMQQVTVPTLLLVGTRDPVVRPRMVQTFELYMPKARLLHIEGGTHAVHDSHSAQIATAVQQFIGQDLANLP